MRRRIVDLRGGEVPLLDVVSYGRAQVVTPSQRQLIVRTVHKVPEVMVKVSGGARTLAGVEKHIAYIGREGDLELETDMGTKLGGPGSARDLASDWDLGLEALSRQSERSIRGIRRTKLVHNLIFSMPAGTSPEKVLKAVRRLAMNEWQLKHRYAMAMHTDSAHPHVHVVVKAMSEQGVRLNIRKATLRSWRDQFAANLRELGVAANATERAARGATRISQSKGYYRASQRGESTRRWEQLKRVSEDIRRDVGERTDSGQEKLLRTRAEVVEGWRSLAAKFRAVGDHGLADKIRVFVGAMQPPLTEKGLLARQEVGGVRELTPGVQSELSRNRTR
jgi:hypothetical protein